MAAVRWPWRDGQGDGRGASSDQDRTAAMALEALAAVGPARWASDQDRLRDARHAAREERQERQ